MIPPQPRGLPVRVYLPILIVSMLAFLAIVGTFLRIGLGSPGSALGAGARIAADVTPAADASPTVAPGEVIVPQTGTGRASGGGATGASGGGPPAAVAQALAQYRSRLTRNPKDLAALIGLAGLYFDAGKFERAVPYYERALALDPANPDTRTDYATTLHGSGRDLEALAQIDTVLRARPDFAPALYNHGVIAAAIGRRSEAIAAFQRYLRLAPADAHAEDARAALHNLEPR